MTNSQENGNVAQGGTGQYLGLSVKELQDLMQMRGTDALDKINSSYKGTAGLCELLKTSVTSGL